MSAAGRDRGPSPMARLGARIGSHATIYILTSASTVAVGLASVALLTRLLEPADFGTLALLLFFQTILTIVINAGSLQGTFSWALGGAGGDEDLAIGPEAKAGAVDRRRALMTGVVLTFIIGLCALAIVLPLSSWIAGWLLGDRAAGDLVWLMAVAAVAHALWRLTANCLRLARRPASYLVATVWMNVSILAASVAALEAGLGVAGVVEAQTVGNLIAVALNLVLLRRELRPAVSLDDARQIMRRGRALIPVVASFYTIQLADIFLVSRTLTNADVGVYRVASRVGSLVSHWTSAFNMAWGPMRRDPLHVAADDHVGRTLASARLVTWFSVLTVWVILSTGLFAEQLVRIAAGAYDDAAPLIPLTATAFAFHGWYVVVYRTSEFKGRRTWFIVLSPLAAITFLACGLVLVPWIGAFGAPIAAICGWSVGIVGMWARAQRSPDRVPYEYRRIAGAVLLAGALYGLGRTLAPDGEGVSGWWARSLVELGAWALYPALVLALRILPMRQVRAVAVVLRPSRLATRRGRIIRERMGALDDRRRRLLVRCVRDRAGVEEVAGELGLPPADVRREAVAALREIGDLGSPLELDDAIGGFVLDDGPFAERDLAGETLWKAGADPLEVDALRRLVDELRRPYRRSAWRSDPALSS